MTVLLAMERAPGPLGLTQIAAASAMAPSKAHRYLVSLARIGLIKRSSSSGLYDFGPSMRRLGIESLRRMDEVGIAADYLPGLRDRTTHAVNLAVWGDHGPVIVRWDYGSYALPITVRIGATMPLTLSSVGRVYLAHLPETLTGPVLQSQSVAGDLPEWTRSEIDDIRTDVLKRGFALTSGGVIPGVTSLAAPVFTVSESLPLVVAVALPATQATDDEVASVATELLRFTAMMSADLGRSDVSGQG